MNNAGDRPGGPHLIERPVVLVTGGTGAVGPAVVGRLQQEGYRVRVLSRGFMRASSTDRDVQLVRGDICDRDAVARAVRDADGVLHLCSYVHPNAFDVDPAECERVNVGGTQVVVEESIGAGVGRLVLFGTIAVYGTSRGADVDEDSAVCPDSVAARTKLRAEQIVRQADGRGRLRTTVLRVAAVYGPGTRGQYVRLLRALARGRFVPVGPGLNRRTLVHERDLAEAVHRVLRSPQAAGRLYNVSDGRIHRLRDVIEAQSRALGRESPRFQVPTRAAWALAHLVDGARAVGRRPPRLVPLLRKYTEDVAVRAERIQRELDFHPVYDLDLGWQDVVRAIGPRLRSHGLDDR